MMNCPHQSGAVRICTGCQVIDDGSGMVACDGEVVGRVIRDSDGDAGVINGIRHFLTVEDMELNCNCTLNENELQAVTDQLCDNDDDGLADMYEDEARHEARYG